jgi:hypothetical protein
MKTTDIRDSTLTVQLCGKMSDAKKLNLFNELHTFAQ